jgi:hypothetical protein
VTPTNVRATELTLTAITDVLAYVAHSRERCRLDPCAVFDAALHRDGTSTLK